MISDTLEHLAVSIGSLRPHERNPRNGDTEAIKESLSVNGQYRPIVVNSRDGSILAGNHTYAAALELGWTEIAATYVDADEEQAKRILLVDNRTNDLAWNDSARIAELLGELGDLSGTGYTDTALEELLAGIEAVEGRPLSDPDDAPEAPAEPVTKRGDVWLLGEHRVMCGDSTMVDDMESLLLNNNNITLLATDPPYGVDYGALVRSRGNQKAGGWQDIESDAATDEELEQLLTDSLDGHSAQIAFVWHPPGARRFVFWRALEANGWRISQEIVWVKNALVFGRSDYQWRHEPCLYAKKPRAPKQEDRTMTTVWEENKPTDSQHPTQKPIALFERPILNHTSSGDAVLDPFGGSGSTLIAAEKTKRIAYLMELSEQYVDVICRRYQEYAGELPVLEQTGELRDFVNFVSDPPDSSAPKKAGV